MLKISNILFFCGVLTATLSAVKPVAWVSKKPLVTQVAPEDAKKKASWLRRKKRKKFRLSKKTVARVALALGISCVGIKLLSKAKLNAIKKSAEADRLLATERVLEAKKVIDEREKKVLADKNLQRRLAEIGTTDDESNVHNHSNTLEMLKGFAMLQDLQKDIKIDFDREIEDLKKYLKSTSCLENVTDRANILKAVEIILGIQQSSTRTGFGNFFDDTSMYKRQFNETTKKELLGRTWYFAKNYIDPSTARPEAGLRDLVITSLAKGVDSTFAPICFTGKVNPICFGIWAGRVFYSEIKEKHSSKEIKEYADSCLSAIVTDVYKKIGQNPSDIQNIAIQCGINFKKQSRSFGWSKAEETRHATKLIADISASIFYEDNYETLEKAFSAAFFSELALPLLPD